MEFGKAMDGGFSWKRCRNVGSGLPFQTLMKDHEIENIVKIDKIDSADNDKSCRYQFLSIDWYNRYQSKSDYRQLSIYRLVFQPRFLTIAPVGIIND